jgi:membrane associated rhomboid family serine protease
MILSVGCIIIADNAVRRILGMFPKVDDTVSWEGHFMGLITGVVLSLAYKTPEI